MQLLSIAALALPAFVAAQYGFVPAATSSSSAAPLPTNIHLVTLGIQNSITFNPSTVNAKVNDTIVFQVSKDSLVQHGVVQSNPNSPCSQMPGGLDTGLLSPGDSYAVTINSTAPISFFCPQTNPFAHCEMAMVMIINPSSPSAITALEMAATSVKSEATATMAQSSGSGVVRTAVPTEISSSGSGSSGAVKGSVATLATLLTAVMGLFVTMA